jgi:hypothetical protein
MTITLTAITLSGATPLVGGFAFSQQYKAMMTYVPYDGERDTVKP